MKREFSLCLAIAAVLISCNLGQALAAGNAPRLPGSQLPLQDAASRANIIAEATLIDLGLPVLRVPGQTAYFHTAFHLTKLLKGKSDPVLQADMTIIDSEELQESTPEKGRDYLIFLAAPETQKTVIKILPNDEPAKNDLARLLAPAGK